MKNNKRTKSTKKAEGKRLKEVIGEHLRLTQKQFADKVGLPVQTVYAYCSGVRNIGAKNILKITEVFPEINYKYIKSGNLPEILDKSVSEKDIKEILIEISKAINSLREEVQEALKVVNRYSDIEGMILRNDERRKDENTISK